MLVFQCRNACVRVCFAILSYLQTHLNSQYDHPYSQTRQSNDLRYRILTVLPATAIRLLQDRFCNTFSLFIFYNLEYSPLPAVSFHGRQSSILGRASLPSLLIPAFPDIKTRRAVFNPTETVTGGFCFSAFAFYKLKRSLSAPIPLLKYSSKKYSH